MDKILEDLWFKGYDQGVRDAYKEMLTDCIGVFKKMNDKLDELNQQPNKEESQWSPARDVKAV